MPLVVPALLRRAASLRAQHVAVLEQSPDDADNLPIVVSHILGRFYQIDQSHVDPPLSCRELFDAARRKTVPTTLSPMAAEGLIDLAASHAGDDEVTIYVKGFLARGEDPDHFGAWLACHRDLHVRQGWGPRAQGYSWPSGRIESVPVPLVTTGAIAWNLIRMVRGVGRFNLFSHVGWLAGEQAVQLVARFISQYIAAARSATERAAALAEELDALARRGARVRLVAHSLGCLQVIEAVARLDPSSRPFSIHLCAPACREDQVAGKLPSLAADRTHLYHTTGDLVLETAFRVMSWGRALGAVGPYADYVGVEAIEVGEHFDFWVHSEYKNRFPRFAAAEPGSIRSVNPAS